MATDSWNRHPLAHRNVQRKRDRRSLDRSSESEQVMANAKQAFKERTYIYEYPEDEFITIKAIGVSFTEGNLIFVNSEQDLVLGIPAGRWFSVYEEFEDDDSTDA